MVFSFIYPHGNNNYANMVKLITEPILAPFRNIQNKFFNGFSFDLSPFLALLALDIVRSIVFSII